MMEEGQNCPQSPQSRAEAHGAASTLGQLGGACAPPPDVADQPTYVNPKQYERILKRRKARAKLETLRKVTSNPHNYLHESRHKHACRRKRGPGGRFLTKAELDVIKAEEAAGGGAVDSDEMMMSGDGKPAASGATSFSLAGELGGLGPSGLGAPHNAVAHAAHAAHAAALAYVGPGARPRSESREAANELFSVHTYRVGGMSPPPPPTPPHVHHAPPPPQNGRTDTVLEAVHTNGDLKLSAAAQEVR